MSNNRLPSGEYKESFKRKVIEEYLSTGCSKISLLRKYKIGGGSPIQHWMRVLGYTDYLQQQESSTFMFSNLLQLSSKKDQNPEDLQEQIRELKRQLQDEKLRSEYYSRIIKKAETELKIPIEKKSGTR